MSANALHSVSVAGVTFDDEGRVLLIERRDNRAWQAPGGVLELDETFEQGVCREVLEETGVAVEAVRLTGVYKNLTVGVVALVYACRPLNGVPRPTLEASQACWLPYEEALTRMAPVFAVRVADAALPSSSSVPTRAHDGVRILRSS